MSQKEKYTLGEAAAIGGLGGAIVAIVVPLFWIITIPFALWDCYVLGRLWAWFVVPLFGLVQPSLWQFYGLFLVIAVFKRTAAKKEEPKVDWSSTMITYVLGPAMLLLAGYLVHHYALHQ